MAKKKGDPKYFIGPDGRSYPIPEEVLKSGTKKQPLRTAFRKNVPESYRMLLPGVSDVEDLAYLSDEWFSGKRGNIGGRALSAGAFALPIVGSKLLRKLGKTGRKVTGKKVSDDIAQNVRERLTIADQEYVDRINLPSFTSTAIDDPTIVFRADLEAQRQQIRSLLHELPEGRRIADDFNFQYDPEVMNMLHGNINRNLLRHSSKPSRAAYQVKSWLRPFEETTRMSGMTDEPLKKIEGKNIGDLITGESGEYVLPDLNNFKVSKRGRLINITSGESLSDGTSLSFAADKVGDHPYLSGFNFGRAEKSSPIAAGKLINTLLDKAPQHSTIDFGSLSEDSFPLTLKMVSRANKKIPGRFSAEYKGRSILNSMGRYNEVAKLDDSAGKVKLLNEQIDNFNQTMGTIIPKTVQDAGSNIIYPQIEYKKLLPGLLGLYGGAKGYQYFSDQNDSKEQYAKGGDIMANLKKLKRRKKMPGGGVVPKGGAVGIKDDQLVEGYAVGTPLHEIYNLPSDMPEQAKLMSLQSTKDALNRTRWANFQGSVTDYPEGQSVPSFRYTPAMNKELKKRGMTRNYIESWQPANYPEEFGVGGNIAKGAASGAMTGMALGPWAAAAGAVVGGVAGWLGGRKEDEAEELVEDYIVPQGLPSQHYQRAAGGGDLTEFIGPRHEEGGITLGGLPVEVEGGETRTGTMIHSDRPEKKITSDMIKKYPALKKSDKGKTMAQITKREHKKFEKRQWDEMNDNAAEITMMPFEMISDDLSQPDEQIAAYGGDISASKAREILSHGSIRGKPITDKQRRFFGAKTKAQDGLNLQSFGKFAPLLTSGVDLVGSLISGPEEVDYGRTSFTPAKVNYASAEPGVQRIRRTFGNAESKLRRYNPNRYMSRMGDLAARESDAVTGHAGQIQTYNTQAANRANLLDAQNATRVNMFNKQIGISEAEANAANRGAWRGRMSANLANIGTIGGQMARDERLYEAQDNYNTMMGDYNQELLKILRGYGNDDTSSGEQLALPPITGYNPDAIPDIQSEENLFKGSIPLNNPFNYRFANGGDLTHRLRLRNFKSV